MGACDKSQHTSSTEKDTIASPNFRYQLVELRDGYVSGCPYEKPHYQMTFDKLRLKRWSPLEKEDQKKQPENTSNNGNQISSKKDTEDKQNEFNREDLKTIDKFVLEGKESEIDVINKAVIFPYGVEILALENIKINADRAVWWYQDKMVYFEKNVSLESSFGEFKCDSFIIDVEKKSGLGKNPYLLTRNPSGILGLGRGSQLPAVARGNQLIVYPQAKANLSESPKSNQIFEAQKGQIRLGETSLFNLPQKYSSDFKSFFGGVRVGRNSRFGLFLMTRLNLLNETFLLKEGSIRTRIQGLENWYEKRGLGHGLDGKYNLKIGSASAEGQLRLLAIDDRDTDNKQTEFTDNTRFFGHWIHRGKTEDQWEWNWEFSRQSDPEVREEFDRKKLRRDKPFENRFFLAKRSDRHRLSFLMQSQTEKFVREVEFLPRIQWDWVDQPLFKNFILDGHLQMANARLIEAEPRKRSAPSIRAERIDFDARLFYPFNEKEFHIEPFLIGNSTWYSRQVDRNSEVIRSQAGVGVVLSTRWHHGIYRLLPRIEARKEFTPSKQSRQLPQIDEIDSRKANEVIEMNWRHLIRKKESESQRDLWDLDVRLSAFPNPRRDNDDRHWSLLDKQLNIRPHRVFETFVQAKYDVEEDKYREFIGGFVINPDSRVDIGTGSNGREVFSGSLDSARQGRGRRSEWAFLVENRYLDREPSRLTAQLDLLPPEKWKVSYAQELLFDGSPSVVLHRLNLNRDLHDWTLSFDLEVDPEDNNQSFSIYLTPSGGAKF